MEVTSFEKIKARNEKLFDDLKKDPAINVALKENEMSLDLREDDASKHVIIITKSLLEILQRSAKLSGETGTIKFDYWLAEMLTSNRAADGLSKVMFFEKVSDPLLGDAPNEYYFIRIVEKKEDVTLAIKDLNASLVEFIYNSILYYTKDQLKAIKRVSKEQLLKNLHPQLKRG